MDSEYQQIMLRLTDLPEGHSTVRYMGSRYRISKSLFNNGRSIKLYAEALDGSDFISFNWYQLAEKIQLKPCEMPMQKVVHFMLNFQR